LRVRRKLREFLVKKELACMPAGIISLGTHVVKVSLGK
jgi:hypothetical protein